MDGTHRTNTHTLHREHILASADGRDAGGVSTLDIYAYTYLHTHTHLHRSDIPAHGGWEGVCSAHMYTCTRSHTHKIAYI